MSTIRLRCSCGAEIEGTPCVMKRFHVMVEGWKKKHDECQFHLKFARKRKDVVAAVEVLIDEMIDRKQVGVHGRYAVIITDAIQGILQT